MTAIRTLPRGVSETPDLFDLNPMAIGGFRLRARSATAVGRPSLANWQTAFQFACASEEASAYWIGDLLEYASTRGDWADMLDQAKAVTGLAEQTLHNQQHVAAKVKGHARNIAPSWSHAREVAKVPTEREQVEWLERAKGEGWTAREMAVNLRRAGRRAIIEGQAVLSGLYRVIYADCPWLYSDRPPSASGAQEHYPGMTVDALCKLPVAAHAYSDAVLFMWVTAPILPQAFPVMDAWGFTYKTGAVWDKVLSAGGHYVAVKHEHLLIATRGSCLPDRPTPQPDSVQVERREGEHSQKPDSFRTLIERMYDGPYLELFGRKPVEGWSVFGNDASLWHQDVAVSA